MRPLSRLLRRRVLPALLPLLEENPAWRAQSPGAASSPAAGPERGRATRPALPRSLLLACLGAASHIFGALGSLRRWLYLRGILQQTHLPVFVISVGNITAGGTGKTPMVEFLARGLQGLHLKPLILTRGYAGGDEARMLQHQLGPGAILGVGRNRADVARQILQDVGCSVALPKHEAGCQSPGACRLDDYRAGDASDAAFSDTRETLGQPAAATGPAKRWQWPMPPTGRATTDEHDLLTPQSPASAFPLTEDGIGAVILDDGMQHLALARDLEIVMVNVLNPFGNRRLLPRGTLREPLTSLSRASAVVLHHADMVPDSALEQLIGEIRAASAVGSRAQGPPVFLSALSPIKLLRLNGLPRAPQAGHSQPSSRPPPGPKLESASLALDALKGVPVVCLSGIGCPRAFEATVTRKVVHHVALADHEEVQPEDVDALSKVWSSAQGSARLKPRHVVLTEKDFHRQPEALKVLLEPFDPVVVSSRLVIRDGRSLGECCLQQLLLEAYQSRSCT